MQRVFILPYCEQCNLPFCDEKTLANAIKAYTGYSSELIEVSENDDTAKISELCLKSETNTLIKPKAAKEKSSKAVKMEISHEPKPKTDIYDVFVNKRPSSPIRFEEFESVGWSEEMFLEYLKHCEIIRAALIVTCSSSNLDDYFEKNVRKDTMQKPGLESMKESLVEDAVENLLMFLNEYSEMDFSIQIPVMHLKTLIRYDLNDGVRQPVMFKFMEDFRGRLEDIIGTYLQGNSIKPKLTFAKLYPGFCN